MINPDQVIYNSRVYQNENIYVYNNILDPVIYLTRFLNLLLRSLVDIKTKYANKVIGCDPFFVDIVNNKIKFAVSAGRLIIDSTLIELPTMTFLDLTINPTYTSIVILAGYKYLTNSNRARLQICYLDEVNHVLVTDGPDLLSMGIEVLVLGKFEIQYYNPAYFEGKIGKIYHPYGLFRKQHYSQFLTSKVSPLAIANDNRIFTRLESKAELYDPFLIDDLYYNISLPLFLDYYWDGIDRFFTHKLRKRYMVYDIYDLYYVQFEHNMLRRTEAFDDQYSYAL